MSDQPLRIIQGAASWQAGYVAGAGSVGSPICPPEIPDALAYQSVYIEGAAAAAQARARAHE